MTGAPRNRSGGVAVICRRFHPEYGGPGIAFWRLAPRLERERVPVIVIARQPAGVPKLETASCLEIHRCKGGFERGGEPRLIASVLGRLIALRHRYRHVHVFHSGWLTFLVPLLARALGKTSSFTMTLLDSDDPVGLQRMTMPWLRLRLFRKYRRYIYINPEQARRFVQVYGTGEPLVAGSVGIDLDSFKPPRSQQRAAARSELGLHDDDLVAAYCGALSRRKGIDQAVEIWLRVVAAEPTAKFVVLGPDYTPDEREASLYPRLAARIDAAGATDRFRFFWSPPDPAKVIQLLHAADIFLFPSRGEGTPSSVMEAMACGVPPVLYPLAGFTGKIVRDQVEGLVLPEGCSADVAAKQVLELLHAPDLRRQWGERGRERVGETHSQDVAVKALMRAWDEEPGA